MRSGKPGLNEPSEVTVNDIVQGLLLFDEPMLNSRYHALLIRDPDPIRRQALQRLPGLVIRSHHLSAIAAQEWQGTQSLGQEFVDQGERIILESFLALAERQLRLIAFMARSAPTIKAREPFDAMADIHREIASELRRILTDLTMSALAASEQEELRSVQEEAPMHDLRGQIEDAILARANRGSGIRRVMLSHVAQRHLRDQGCFSNGDVQLMGLPVAIDMSWEAPAFVLEGFDVVPMEEIARDRSG